jgi:tRNA(adenine34) deaminase
LFHKDSLNKAKVPKFKIGEFALNTMINPFTDEYFMKKLCRKLKWLLIKAKFPLGLLLSSMSDRASHNLTELNDVTAHAEMQAITAAANYLGGKYLVGCTLYVTP